MEYAYPCREIPESLEGLVTLALDLRWTWCRDGDGLWRSLDPRLWERTRNPWRVLQNVSAQRLQQAAADQDYRAELDHLLADREDYLSRESWYARTHGYDRLKKVAYFSLEYGLGDALRLYAGGLGVLAGDFLKAGSDLGLPLVGVGLLYHEGYFRQLVDADGRQQEVYPYSDILDLPVQPVRREDAGWLRVAVDLPGRELRLRVWEARVGRVLLYLLDSNDPLNYPADRGITSRLYEGGEEIRLLQEIVLGIGGWRALKALGLEPDICHLNEGHAAFVVLERARDFMQTHKVSPREALWATRAGNVFTTHTPVAAGFDTFAPGLVARYFKDYAEEVGATIDELLALGTGEAVRDGERFSMAHVAMRGCVMANGVSALHGGVSRRLFARFYPDWPVEEVPVGHVTNGVHVPSWESEWADALWSVACGKGRWLGDLKDLEQSIEGIPDDQLWAFRAKGRQDLVRYARRRLAWQLAQRGAPSQQIEAAHLVLDPNVLTIGFARRFTEYKRTNLLLYDPDRLARILADPDRPVQLLVAGKAHPADGRGKELLKAWLDFVQRPGMRGRAVFLADYDIDLAQELDQGVDLWVNTPRRPWEACGTSGMKVLANGGLNVSVRDGWWDEAYQAEVGWAIGGGVEPGGPEADAADAAQLYRLLEEKIVPEFYDRDAEGIPLGWVARMRASMSRLVGRFSATRMVQEYVEQAYLPVAELVAQRTALSVAAELARWEQGLRAYWHTIHFGNVETGREEGAQRWRVQVYLGELPADSVRVELYAEPTRDRGAQVIPMERGQGIPGALNAYIYTCRIEAEMAERSYTPRVVAHHPLARVPIEARQIKWHR